MKLTDIRNEALRAWVADYTGQRLEEHKKNHAKVEQLKHAWASYSEGDWGAWRELLDLRPRARAKFELGEIDRAIHAKLDAQPRLERNGISYPSPYSFGVEVAALKELLGELTIRQVVAFDEL